MVQHHPLDDDLILRPVASIGGTLDYVIVEAVTLRREAGPFSTLSDATFAARDLAALRGVAVWLERADESGHLLGSPVLMFQGRI